MFTKKRHQKFLILASAFAALFVYGCSENPVGVSPDDMQAGSVQTQDHSNWW